jgi:hypothetical protein
MPRRRHRNGKGLSMTPIQEAPKTVPRIPPRDRPPSRAEITAKLRNAADRLNGYVDTLQSSPADPEIAADMAKINARLRPNREKTLLALGVRPDTIARMSHEEVASAMALVDRKREQGRAAQAAVAPVAAPIVAPIPRWSDADVLDMRAELFTKGFDISGFADQAVSAFYAVMFPGSDVDEAFRAAGYDPIDLAPADVRSVEGAGQQIDPQGAAAPTQSLLSPAQGDPGDEDGAEVLPRTLDTDETLEAADQPDDDHLVARTEAKIAADKARRAKSDLNKCTKPEFGDINIVLRVGPVTLRVISREYSDGQMSITLEEGGTKMVDHRRLLAALKSLEPLMVPADITDPD